MCSFVTDAPVRARDVPLTFTNAPSLPSSIAEIEQSEGESEEHTLAPVSSAKRAKAANLSASSTRAAPQEPADERPSKRKQPPKRRVVQADHDDSTSSSGDQVQAASSARQPSQPRRGLLA